MIIYPVDVENTRWAVWSISEALLLNHNKPWPRADGEEIVDMDPDLVPLLEVDEAQPVYDPATHYLNRTEGVEDIPNNTHTHGWEILPISQDDLDWTQEQQTAKAQYDDLQNSVGTNEERLTRTERVCAHLLKLAYGI